jgi:hypothetical protein
MIASSIWKMCFAVDEESEVPRATASAPPWPETMLLHPRHPWPELASPARRIRSAQARARQSAPPPSTGLPPHLHRKHRAAHQCLPISETEPEMLWPSEHTHRGLQTPTAAC